jgi:hypothetical protein
MDKISQFFMTCSEQVHLDVKRFCRLGRNYASICFELAMYDRNFASNCIEPLQRAIDFVADPNEIVPMHLGLIRACIFSKQYTTAYPYVVKNYLSVNKDGTDIKPNEVI